MVCRRGPARVFANRPDAGARLYSSIVPGRRIHPATGTRQR